jgi:hypothetical protein
MIMRVTMILRLLHFLILSNTKKHQIAHSTSGTTILPLLVLSNTRGHPIVLSMNLIIIALRLLNTPLIPSLTKVHHP